MKLKIPPLVVLALCGVCLWFIDRYWLGVFSYSFMGQAFVAKSLMIAAVVLVFSAIWQFKKHKTTIDPTSPSKSSYLITSGVFAQTRNPIYLSMLIMLLAAVVKVGNPAGIISPVFFWWFTTTYQIKPEEAALSDVFGDKYIKYCKKVRRWV